MYEKPFDLERATREMLIRERLCGKPMCEGELQPSGSVAVKCPAGSDGDMERLTCSDCGAVYYA